MFTLPNVPTLDKAFKCRDMQVLTKANKAEAYAHTIESNAKLVVIEAAIWADICHINQPGGNMLDLMAMQTIVDDHWLAITNRVQEAVAHTSLITPEPQWFLDGGVGGGDDAVEQETEEAHVVLKGGAEQWDKVQRWFAQLTWTNFTFSQHLHQQKGVMFGSMWMDWQVTGSQGS